MAEAGGLVQSLPTWVVVLILSLVKVAEIGADYQYRTARIKA